VQKNKKPSNPEQRKETFFSKRGASEVVTTYVTARGGATAKGHCPEAKTFGNG